ncbi:MAG: WG repeat-containing protein [Prevotellaceae bacterium]|jgi:hypothetical protein|nr:WG repeat-containing protein [Prevotellaceae bacterium]
MTKKIKLFLLVALIFSGVTINASAQSWLKKALDKVDKALGTETKDNQQQSGNNTEQQSVNNQETQLHSTIVEEMRKGGTFDFKRSNSSAPEVKKIFLKEYTTDYQFRDGMLAVKNAETGKWGFFNEQGEKVIDFLWEYTAYGTPKFGGGACAVYKSTGQYSVQWYIIDKTGKEIAFPKNATISDFCDGYAVVRESTGQIHKRYYINNQGQHVFPHLDEETYANKDLRAPRPFKDGLAAYYSYTKNLYGYIDATGKIVVQPQFVRAEDFSEGMAVVLVPATGTTPLRWGYIDTSGKMAIEAKFSNEVLSFHDGYAAVQKTNGKVVFIDKQGNVASPEYKDARRFCHGYAFVETAFSEIQVVNTKFEVIRELQKDYLRFPNRSGSLGSFTDPFVLLDFGNYVVTEGEWGNIYLFTADGQPCINITGRYQGEFKIDAFYGKLARAGNGIVDFEKSLQSGVAHFIFFFAKPEF